MCENKAQVIGTERKAPGCGFAWTAPAMDENGRPFARLGRGPIPIRDDEDIVEPVRTTQALMR